jgi:hypothetical protein
MTIPQPSDTWRVIVQAFILPMQTIASQKQNETGHQTTITSHARKQPNPAQKKPSIYQNLHNITSKHTKL